jgi:LAO/AO transport system kinase
LGSEAERLALAVEEGDPRAIARAMTWLEEDDPRSPTLLGRLHPHTGRALLIGVTGAPGAGKSTLVDRLTARVRREGKSVGVVAVDPTSPWTGGAILGDRIRMQGHATDRGVFIRSMASRGHLGGLASTTNDLVSVLDAAGKDVVLVETVGVGQGEVEIASEADVTVVVLVPGQGDEVQTLKAGLLEVADVFVINKSEREGAARLLGELRTMIALGSALPAPPIVETVATRDEGTEALWAAVQAVGARSHASGERARRRREQMRQRIEQMVADTLRQRILDALPAGEADRLLDLVMAGELDPHAAVEHMLAQARP